MNSTVKFGPGNLTSFVRSRQPARKAHRKVSIGVSDYVGVSDKDHC